MFAIEYSKDSRKTLKSLPVNTRLLIMAKIDELAVNPFVANNNVKKLEGRSGYRLRVGGWRGHL